jgi:hypothetical protein
MLYALLRPLDPTIVYSFVQSAAVQTDVALALDSESVDSAVRENPEEKDEDECEREERWGKREVGSGKWDTLESCGGHSVAESSKHFFRILTQRDTGCTPESLGNALMMRSW